MLEKLRGSVVPLPTPFRQGSLDITALQALIQRQLDGGSQAVSVGGSTGGALSLTLEDRKQLLQAALSFCRRKVPVLVGTGAAWLFGVPKFQERFAKIITEKPFEGFGVGWKKNAIRTLTASPGGSSRGALTGRSSKVALFGKPTLGDHTRGGG